MIKEMRKVLYATSIFIIISMSFLVGRASKDGKCDSQNLNDLMEVDAQIIQMQNTAMALSADSFFAIMESDNKRIRQNANQMSTEVAPAIARLSEKREEILNAIKD
jgi:hypothetical protein